MNGSRRRPTRWPRRRSRSRPRRPGRTRRARSARGRAGACAAAGRGARRARARRRRRRGGRRERGEETRRVQLRRHRRPDRDVAEVPGRVGRVQQRDEIAPAARGERVERRAVSRRGGRAPSLLPHITTPAPKLITRTCDAGDTRRLPSSPRASRADGARRTRGCCGRGSGRPPPTRRDRAAEQRQAGARVGAPQRVPGLARRLAELERGDPPARARRRAPARAASPPDRRRSAGGR